MFIKSGILSTVVAFYRHIEKHSYLDNKFLDKVKGMFTEVYFYTRSRNFR